MATGSSPLIPEIEGIEDVEYHTNETVFEVDELPRRVIFIGGGPIGLELAQAFSHLGSEAVVIEQHDEILVKEDKEIREMANGFIGKGYSVSVWSGNQTCIKGDGQKVVHYVKEGEEHSVEGDLLFLATGRKPGTDSLNLSAAGVEVDDRGFIEVNDELRTNHNPYFRHRRRQWPLPIHPRSRHGRKTRRSKCRIRIKTKSVIQQTTLDNLYDT